MNWSDLRSWKSAPIFDAYDEVSRCEQILSDASQGLSDAGAALQSEGDSASAARDQVQILCSQADKLEALLTDLMKGCLGAAGEVVEIEARVPDTDSYARAERLVISDPGNVAISEERQAEIDRLLASEDRSERDRGISERGKAIRAQKECQRQVTETLRQANVTDRNFRSVLTSVAAGEVSDAASLLSQLNGQGTGGIFDGKTPGEVQALWQSMSQEEQLKMREMDPEGLLNKLGLPEDVLEEASRVKMDNEIQDMLRRRDEIDKRLKELEGEKLTTADSITGDTAAGREKRQLEIERKQINEGINQRQRAINNGGFVIYDPANGNIVERVHTGGSGPTEHVITYQHGTNGKFEDVLDGSSGAVARDIVGHPDAKGSTDLYIHHQGKGIGWVGDDANSNHEFINSKGEQLADFQQSLYVQEKNRDAQYHAIGHSAGNSVVTASEKAGAHYDTVTSLSGSFMPVGWQPDPNTEYSHYHYEGEPINAVGALEHSPREDPAFHSKQFESGQGFDQRPWWTSTSPAAAAYGVYDMGKDAFDSHTTSNKGYDQNKPIIDQVVKDIYEK